MENGHSLLFFATQLCIPGGGVCSGTDGGHWFILFLPPCWLRAHAAAVLLHCGSSILE